MRFPESIKWRMTTWYLLMSLLVLSVFSIFSYFSIAQSISLNNAPTKSYVVDVSVTNTSVSPIGETRQDTYQLIYSYTIQDKGILAIVEAPASIISIVSPAGNVPLDQKGFINTGTNGDQEVWVYYRQSRVDPAKVEMLVLSRSVTEKHQLLGQYTNILIYALPIFVILAGLVGFFLLKRMLRPIDTITNAAKLIALEAPVSQIQKSGDEFAQLASNLDRAFKHLQNSVDLERQFIADASHELRTPLTVMQGETTLAMAKSRTPEEYKKYLDVFSKEGSYLSSIINRLLLLARLDSNPGLLNVSVVDLSSLLKSLSSDIVVLCEEKKSVAFTSEVKDGITLHGDEMQLKELFLNLLDNAIKYTSPGGHISLSLRTDKNQAIVQVSDTGIGISKEHFDRIFERFYRVDKARSRNEGGSGLGLAICKRIVDLHGGRIEVTSEEGKGSTFTVILPLKTYGD